MKRFVLGFALLLVLLVPSQSSLSDDVTALINFKRAIFLDPYSVLSDWSADNGDPCNWSGISCSSAHDSVVTLNLSDSSLKGFLAPELGQLTSLQELFLDNNMLLGTIPKQIGLLTNLRVLDMSVNRLSGPIPPELGNLSSITIINLHSNGLTGTIPPELGKLQNVVELRLDRNRLRGSIPGSSNKSSTTADTGSTTHDTENGLCPSPKLNVGDFSYNFLVGKIPPCLKYLPRSSFQGNCFQDGYSILQRALEICTGHTVHGGQVDKKSTTSHKHQHLQQPIWLLILEITTGVLVVVFVVTVAVTASKSCKLKPSIRISSWNRTKSWSDEIAISVDGEMLKNVPRLSRQELEVACEDFSNIIGSSPASVVYKGTLKDGPEIAVVSLCTVEGHWTSNHEYLYQNKVADLVRLNHENVAKFLGYCKESEPFSRMLVFEYASNGTLYEHLHYCEGSQISWVRRMKIATGIARGLRYLHTELQPPFAVTELNSTAIHVTEDFAPKIVDFECWKMFTSKYEKSPGHLTNGGSFHGYTGSLEQEHLDIQGNTFAFGVILLEIVSGRPSYCKDRGYLVDWATNHLQQPEEIGKLVDPELTNVRTDDLAVICSVVSSCIDPDPSKRPSMQIITGVLENGIDLSAAAVLKDSPLAWAELALSS